jgi:hypothetical protein
MRAVSAGAGERLRLLVFTVAGIRFAVDADQVASLRDSAPEGADDRLLWLHEAFGCDGFSRESLRRPQRCTLRRGGETFSVMIEAPEDLIETDTERILPLPALVEPFVLKNGIWAALPDENGAVILLVDFLRMATMHDLWTSQGET